MHYAVSVIFLPFSLFRIDWFATKLVFQLGLAEPGTLHWLYRPRDVPVCDYLQLAGLLVSSDLVTIVATHQAQHQGHPLTFSSSAPLSGPWSVSEPRERRKLGVIITTFSIASCVRDQCGPAAGTVNSRQEADGSGDEDSDSGQSGLCASCLVPSDRATRKYWRKSG